jgi:quercetin dioxygenase-like cupin family protein
MKRTFAGLGAALALVLLGSTALAAEKKAAASKHKAKPALVMKTPDDLKWVPNPGAPDQVSMAVVSGDPDKGPHKAFHKFKAGFNAGLHTHSSDIAFAVLSGTVTLAPEGGETKKLPPGSYAFQPHGVRHVTGCDPASDCLIFTVASGKFDLIPAQAKK